MKANDIMSGPVGLDTGKSVEREKGEGTFEPLPDATQQVGQCCSLIWSSVSTNEN